MSQKFNRVDYLSAKATAMVIPQGVSVHANHVFAQIVVPLLTYYLAHISEHRRGIPVSTVQFREKLKEEVSRRVRLRGTAKDLVVEEVMRHATTRASEIWKPREEAVEYKTANVVLAEFAAFLEEQK